VIVPWWHMNTQNLNRLCISKVFWHLPQFYSYPQNQFLVMLGYFDNFLDKSFIDLMPLNQAI
jgi:hypothetical protein